MRPFHGPQCPRVAPALAAFLPSFFASIILAQPSQQTGVHESVVVRSAEIQVLVLDSRGRPVRDLRPEEFLLTVDGQAQQIDWVLRPGKRPLSESKARSGTAPGQEAPDPSAGSVARALEPPLPHSTVFFIDELHLSFGSRNRGLFALSTYLKTLPPEEEVAIYSLGKSLQLVQRFTRDRGAIRAALGGSARRVPLFLEESAEQTMMRSGDVLSELSMAMAGIAGRPEPKTLVIVAESVPSQSFDAPRSSNPTQGNPQPLDFRKELEEATRAAFFARATVLALDPSGIPASGRGLICDTSVLFSSTDGSPSTASSASGFGADAFASQNDAFADLATGTGGARLTLSNDLAQLLVGETQRLSSRYRIGFTPRVESPRTRAIAVRVTRPGLLVRTASGQASLSGDALARARFASALLSAEPLDSDFAIQVARKGEPVKNLLPLEVSIPAREFLLTDTGDSLIGRIEIQLAAEDDRGGLSRVFSQVTGIKVLKAEISRIPHDSFRASFSVPVHGKGLVIVRVRDPLTDRVGEGRLSYGE